MMDHFRNHKQKYLGFLVVALLVIFAARAVVVSEAQVNPYGMMADGNITIPDNCPPFLRHFRFLPPSLLRHPCFLFNQVENPTVVPAPSDATPAPSTTDASSTATTTADTASSTATSTATTTQDVASSTQASTTPESTTTPQVPAQSNAQASTTGSTAVAQ